MSTTPPSDELVFERGNGGRMSHLLKRLWVSIIFSSVLLSSGFASAGECNAPWKAVEQYELADTGGTYLLLDMKTSDYDAIRDSESTDVGGLYAQYQKWVKSFAGNLDPYVRIEEQRKRAVLQSTYLMDRMLLKEVGQIRPVRCLEALLLNEHLTRQDKYDLQSELYAHVIKNGEQTRIHFITTPAALLSFKDPDVFIDRLNKDLSSGWKYDVHMHSHPFLKSDEDQAGTLVPSGVSRTSPGDVAYYLGQREEIKQAWITNGFHTAVFKNEEFDLLAPPSLPEGRRSMHPREPGENIHCYKQSTIPGDLFSPNVDVYRIAIVIPAPNTNRFEYEMQGYELCEAGFITFVLDTPDVNELDSAYKYLAKHFGYVLKFDVAPLPVTQFSIIGLGTNARIAKEFSEQYPKLGALIESAPDASPKQWIETINSKVSEKFEH